MWNFFRPVYFWHITLTGFQNNCPNLSLFWKLQLSFYTQDTASVIPHILTTQNNLKVIMRIFHSIKSHPILGLKIQPQNQLPKLKKFDKFGIKGLKEYIINKFL